MGTGSILLSGGGKPFIRPEVTFGVDGYMELGESGIYITTTHISILIVLAIILAFALIANRAIKKADPDKVPGTFLNIVEYLVEAVDNLTKANMGTKGYRFANYIGTIAIFIIVSNISGLIGLRPPTADYGVTLGLALITFVLIHYNGFKYQKLKHVTDLFKPLLLSPINIIGEIATPISMSLRLFGNILSGTVMMGLIYGLLPKFLLILWPGVLHIYFDLFSGAIQTYVFCMLNMVYISQAFGDDE